MVVDEELKMMCDICSEGGQILGPYLKPMTHLIHTEYILAGRTIEGRPRRPALLDVRRHRHRQPGRERLPADQEVRDQGPRLLRRGDGAARPRRRRRGHRRRTDPAAYRRRDPSTGGCASRPGRRWSATPTRHTRSPRRTPRPAASCAPSGSFRPRPRRRGDIADAGRRRGRAGRSSAGATSGSAGSGSTTSPTPSLRRRWPASTWSSSTARTTSSGCCGTCSACSG